MFMNQRTIEIQCLCWVSLWKVSRRQRVYWQRTLSEIVCEWNTTCHETQKQHERSFDECIGQTPPKKKIHNRNCQ